ncbi:MAG: TPR end-of-group domain-containing protein [Candidatus Acidiferrales bacterium]
MLPFVTANAQQGPVDDYVAFGMTEAMIAELSRSAGLKVTSQTSVLQYKGVRKPLPQIARELGVGAILEGSVVREGEQVRITVQLIDARSDTHIWAQTYRRDAATVLSQQTELAQTIVRDMGSGLLPASTNPHSDLSPVNAQAREAYVKGRFFLQKAGKERNEAKAYLEQALAAEPHAPRTLSALADYYLLADSVPPAVGMPKAREYAQMALARNEALADAHLSLGFVHFYGDWDWPGAEREFRRALELEPNFARAHRWYALYLSAMGRHGEAETHIEKALQLDPVSIMTSESAGAVWVNARKYDRALEQGRRILELDANDPRGFEYLANGYAFSGNLEKALEEAGKAVAASKEYSAYFYLQGFVHGLAGNQKAARASLEHARRSALNGYTPATFPAVVYGSIGDRDAAFRHLEDAFRAREWVLVTLKVAPYFDSLRDDPRFQDLLRRMKLP